MDRFFAPAVWLVNRLSYPWKFAVLSVLFVIMLAPPFWGLIGYVKFNVDFSAKERVGVEYMAPLKTLLLDVARHQRQVELARGGNAEAMGQLSGLQKRLDDELAEMDDLNTRLDPQLATDKDWQALKKSWLSLKAESLAIPPAQSAKRHDEVLDLGNALITTIGKTSNLVLDPDVDSYYLMDSVLYRFIPLVQTADQLRVLGANLATKKSITLREQIELVTLETRLRGLLDLTEGNFGETTGYNDSLKPTLEPKFQLYHESVENLLTIVHNGLTTKYDNQAAITVSPALIHQRTMALVDATEAAYDVQAPMLDDLIGIRIENVFLKPFYGTLIATAIVILLIAYFFYGFYLSVAGTVSSLEDGAQRIGKGDLTTRLQIDTRDELSRVAHSFNDIAETFQRLIGEIRNGALHVASSSEELSATSSQMKAGAHGLTNMAANTLELAAGVKGSLKTVATAVEHSTSSIRQVHNASGLVEENIHSVQSAAKSVADNMQTVAAAAEEMSASVNTVASAIEEMSASLGEVARSATQGASVANVAEQRASQTKDTIDTLGKSAREIEQVLEVIKEIAAQTNLLALNATIEAASAGEAGKGFAVVANEVKALARRSAEATEDIRSRIQGIQTNMGAAVHAIGDISSVITEMNQINNTIASAVEEQNATVDEITRSVSQVALSAQEVSKNVHNAAGRAGEVTVQVAKATENMRQINRNMDELSNGAVEIRQAVDRSENDALSMVDNMGQVNTASKETESGVANIELTATQLASLATELESIIGQFKVG